MSQPQQSAEDILKAHGNAITELVTQVKNLRGLGTLIDTANKQVDALASLQKSTDKPRPKASLPEIDKFNGTSSHWETWFPMITAKLELDGASMGSEKAQVSTYTPDLKIKYSNWSSLNLFKDSANQWPEHIQMATHRRAISSDLKEKLRLVDKPSSYTDLVSKLQQLAGSLPHSSDKTTSNGGDKMDIGAIAEIGALDLSCIPEDVESGHSDNDDVEEFITEQQNYSAKHV